MPIRSVSHFTWMVLRTAKRSKTPPTGRALRLAPTAKTKSGQFLNALVEAGLLVRVTGSAAAPFEATYALSVKGEDAAEYGQHEYDLVRASESPADKKPAPKKGKGKK